MFRTEDRARYAGLKRQCSDHYTTNPYNYCPTLFCPKIHFSSLRHISYYIFVFSHACLIWIAFVLKSILASKTITRQFSILVVIVDCHACFM